MKNKAKLMIAGGVGLAAVVLIASIAGLYSIPFAIAALGAAMMLTGNHLGVYALPAATITVLKKAIRFALIAIVVVWVWGLVSSARKAKGSKNEAPASTVDSSRKYVQAQNFSDMEGDFVPITIQVPAAGQWVSVKLKMGYDAELLPSVPMVFDYLDGRPLVHDRPGVKIDTGKITSAFDVMGEGVGGVLKIRCYRIKASSAAPPERKEERKVPSKRVRMSRKNLANVDVPHSVQIM